VNREATLAERQKPQPGVADLRAESAQLRARIQGSSRRPVAAGDADADLETEEPQQRLVHRFFLRKRAMR